ncbi:MAG: hypothetical protein VYE15_02700, partial [Myxococcota bacterium]|nr:hypothetical protein [Myxococcota bacterium]
MTLARAILFVALSSLLMGCPLSSPVVTGSPPQPPSADVDAADGLEQGETSGVTGDEDAPVLDADIDGGDGGSQDLPNQRRRPSEDVGAEPGPEPDAVSVDAEIVEPPEEDVVSPPEEDVSPPPVEDVALPPAEDVAPPPPEEDVLSPPEEDVIPEEEDTAPPPVEDITQPPLEDIAPPEEDIAPPEEDVLSPPEEDVIPEEEDTEAPPVEDITQP